MFGFAHTCIYALRCVCVRTHSHPNARSYCLLAHTYARTLDDLVEGARDEEVRLVEAEALGGPRQRAEEGELLGVAGVPHRGTHAEAWVEHRVGG